MNKPLSKPRAAATLFLLLAGFAGLSALENLSLVNTGTLSLEGISALSISYGQDEVILRESDSKDLVIREYMNRNNSRYYADVSRRDGALHIRQGARPWFFGFFLKVRAEIYLPLSFRENLRIANSSGKLSGNVDLLDYKTIDISTSSGVVALNRLSAQTVSIRVSSGDMDISGIGGSSFVSVSSGKLRIGELAGAEHRIKVSSGHTMIGVLQGGAAIELSNGDMVFEKVRGRIELDVSSGSVNTGNFSGEGRFALSSGKLNMDVEELTGDLRFRLSSGGVDMNIPGELFFNLDAVIKSGQARVAGMDGEILQVSGNSTVLRPIGPAPEPGDSPALTIYARMASGNMTINRR
ncbi:MAG: DUF4097 domain-containing protein [Treponema sp.]|jgi:hypothetical protein|nr:DUF4097 domain-containing protein [Treponema sp.]